MRLAKRYYAKLYREYAIVDLSRYKVSAPFGTSSAATRVPLAAPLTGICPAQLQYTCSSASVHQQCRRSPTVGLPMHEAEQHVRLGQPSPCMQTAEQVEPAFSQLASAHWRITPSLPACRKESWG